MTSPDNKPPACDGDPSRTLRLELLPEPPRGYEEHAAALRAKMEARSACKRRLREVYGVHVNYVAPMVSRGRKVWAIGNRLFLDRPPDETFHGFILAVLRDTFGDAWWRFQDERPEHERHMVYRCFEEFRQDCERLMTTYPNSTTGMVCLVPNGWADYLMSLAWDVVSLMHGPGLPNALIERLRDHEQFQGARYEIAVAAIFARLNCHIRFLDDDQQLRDAQHVEFVATHRPTGQTFAVEAKSRHRPGVINAPRGANLGDPLRNDARMVRRLFQKAIDKAPDGLPFFIFIDINAPLTAEVERWWRLDIQRWMSKLPTPTEANPSKYNGLFVTSFSPH